MGRFVAECAVKSCFRHRRFRGESSLQPELAGRDGVRRLKLAHNENEIARIAFDQIPTIGLKLVKDALGEPGGTVKVHRFLAPDEQTEQMVKPDEMIHMRVRDEDLVGELSLPRRQ